MWSIKTGVTVSTRSDTAKTQFRKYPVLYTEQYKPIS